MFEGSVGREDRVVWFNDSSGYLQKIQNTLIPRLLPKGNEKIQRQDKQTNLRSRVDGEFQFTLLAIINREPLHQQRGETGASASSEGMEDKESL